MYLSEEDILKYSMDEELDLIYESIGNIENVFTRRILKKKDIGGQVKTVIDKVLFDKIAADLGLLSQEQRDTLLNLIRALIKKEIDRIKFLDELKTLSGKSGMDIDRIVSPLDSDVRSEAPGEGMQGLVKPTSRKGKGYMY